MGGQINRYSPPCGTEGVQRGLVFEQFALAVFSDSEGTFDRAKIKALSDPFEKGTYAPIIRWIKSLKDKQVTPEQKLRR